MKLLLPILTFLLLLSACGRQASYEEYTEQNVEYNNFYSETYAPNVYDDSNLSSHDTTYTTVETPESELEAEPNIGIELSVDLDLALAARLFARAEAAWDADDGALWGIPLHRNLAIACRETGYVAANRPFSAEFIPYKTYIQNVGYHIIYVGRPPVPLQRLNYRDWTIETWANLEYDETRTLRTLFHYNFHAIQPQIHGNTGVMLGVSIDVFSEKGQNSFILEVAALVDALHSEGYMRLTAINDALYFRNARRYVYNTANAENMAEIGEGLVTYTELVLALSCEEICAKVSRFPHSLKDRSVPHFVTIAWPYYSGVLYALLLDEFEPNWRAGNIVYRSTDLGQLLQNAAGLTELVPPADLERYGYTEISASTIARLASP
jgi:hypothetical protein